MIGYYEGFDYGGGIAEKEDNFILWSTTGSRTCLVDADLLPYRVGFTINETSYLAAKALVADGTCKDIKDTPQFESAFDQLCATLNKWVRDTKCDSAILYSTKSDSNFRLDIAYTDCYKGQRTAEKPPFFQELKDAMTDALGCELADGIEADDKLSIEASRRTKLLGVVAGSLQHKEFCDCVIASSDKDSAITPCWNYNPDTRKLQWVTKMGELLPKYKNAMVKDYAIVGTGVFWKRGEKAGQEKTKRVCIGEKPSSAIEKLKGSGLKFFYAQIIMGDMADNYKGLKGKGMTAAYELLNNCKTEKELYLATLAAYKEVYGTGKHWCPHYKGTQSYYDEHVEHKGCEPEDWEFWKGKGAWLTAYDRMLEQGRLAWMMTYEGDIWRKDKGAVIDPHDKEFWHDPD
ncbi:5'-3'exonuclease (endogenous virus) [Gutovirus Vc1]|uniref:5'-3'exonuclease n=1 Tax=Vibrio phage Vc1 TaxID=1480731 RepID=X2KU85_9CAUD|nr:exonuclease [Vibrio phage Vc1]AHN84691.1 5'-3'exonuclease [Vibrio phage Vc1]